MKILNNYIPIPISVFLCLRKNKLFAKFVLAKVRARAEFSGRLFVFFQEKIELLKDTVFSILIRYKYFFFLLCFLISPVVGNSAKLSTSTAKNLSSQKQGSKKINISIKKTKHFSPKVLKKYSSTSEPFLVEVLAENLGIVWGMVFINEKELLFTERKGHIKKLNIQTGKITAISGAPTVYAKGQGGLLDIALHPHFSKNKKIYISYSKPIGEKQTTAIASGLLKKNKLDRTSVEFVNSKIQSPLKKNLQTPQTMFSPLAFARAGSRESNKISITQLKDIFVATPFISSRRHFGSRLVFDKKGFLYVTVGDRVERHLAQKLDNHLGKVLRLTDKGKAPKDNPFVFENSRFKNSAAKRKVPKRDGKIIPNGYIKDALPEIWSFGHRNPQGLFIHPKTGQLWEQEHGPRGGDEINLIKKGKNYGWPVITYGREYWGPKIGEGMRKKGMEQPIKYYTPSIAPSGLLIYSGRKFKKWKYHFFSGALVLRHLNRIKVSKKQKVKEEERLLSDLNFRVRHVIEGPKGFIYISVDKGQILRLRPL
ncbi:MAG: PQQ-dependent sugar dehydrogenase [Bdellovibrionales bacterium]|nr:PQQ-dependent sugar dehydrogenase [Bdellovibrionales bacterium]